MPTDKEFVDFVVEQSGHEGEVRAKPLFGEYALYLRNKLVALICDGKLFVKPTKAGRQFIGAVHEAPPYPGAKPSFQIDEQIEDSAWLSELLEISYAELPEPKVKLVLRKTKT